MASQFTTRNRLVGEALARARELYLEGSIGPAIEELASAVEQFPAEIGIRLYLALYLGQEKRFDEAIEHAREAVRSRPDWEKASAVLFHLLTAAGQCGEAMEEAERCAGDVDSGDIGRYLRERLKECGLEALSLDEEAIAE